MQARPINAVLAKILTLAFLSGFLMVFIAGCKKSDTVFSTETLSKSAPKQNPSRDLDLMQVTGDMVAPLTLVEAPDHSSRLFVVDQIGKVWIIGANGQKLPEPFIDIAAKMVQLMPGYDERGLLGLAFHPSYASNGKFYLFYTAPPPPGGPTHDAGNTGLPMVWNNTTTISEFHVSADPNKADINSEIILLSEPHPQFNHNGGTIAFGPDGYLYISIGDGGNKNDIGPGHVEDWYAFNAGGNGQDIQQNLKGNILRIDVNSTSGGKNYAIPADNPFVGKPGLDEIWAYGFRNPYRFSFDISGSRRLYVGDAGQSLYEEIDDVRKGGNYGWNVKEGTVCFNAANEFVIAPDCPDQDVFGNKLIDPVIQAPNRANPAGGNFLTVVAGHVYRGNSIPGMQGKYIFANFSSSFAPEGEIYISQPGGNGLWGYTKLSFKSFGAENIQHYVKGFGQDIDGEVYVLASKILGPSGNTGVVFKMVGLKKQDSN